MAGRRSSRRHARLGYLLVAPAILLIALLIIYPLGEAIYLSLTRSSFITPKPVFVGLDNYRQIIRSETFRAVVRNSLTWTVAVVAMQFVAGMATALLLNQRFLGRGALRALVIIPWVMPGIIGGILWKLLYEPYLGIVNRFLMGIGLINEYIPWLARTDTVMPAVIVAAIWKGTPFSTLMYLAASQNVSQDLIEAAQLDGASWWQRLWTVILPEMAPTIRTTILLASVWTFNYFDLIYIMTGGGPATASHIFPTYVYELAFRKGLEGQAATYGIVSVLVLLVFSILYIRELNRDRVFDLEDDTLPSRAASSRSRRRAYSLPGSHVISGILVVLRPTGYMLALVHRAIVTALRVLPPRLPLYLLVVLVAAFFGVPLYWMILTSIKTPGEIFTTPPTIIPSRITLENYGAVLDATYVRFFWNSLVVALGTTVLALTFGIFASYAFSRLRFRGRKPLLMGIILTQLLPMAVLIVPIYRIMRRLELLNTHPGLMIAYLTFDLPVVIWLMRGFYAGIPRELEEAAQVDGATQMGAFLRVTLPLSMPGILATGAYAFFMAWQDFMFALAFMSSNEMRTLPLGVLSYIGEHGTDWGKLMASSVLLMIPIFVIFTLVQRQFVAGLTRGAVKG
ncbi:MAG: hypothetical protein C4346_01560 [Chloroflexota bacterium]